MTVSCADYCDCIFGAQSVPEDNHKRKEAEDVHDHDYALDDWELPVEHSVEADSYDDHGHRK